MRPALVSLVTRCLCIGPSQTNTLVRDSAHSVIGHINFNFERLSLVWLAQNWFAHDEPFDFFKSLLLFFSPMPFDPFFKEVIDQSCNFREVGDETSVEIGKSLERVVFRSVGRDLPLPNTRNLDWVHHDCAIF